MCIDLRLQFVRCNCKLMSFYFDLHFQSPNTNHHHNFYFYFNYMYKYIFNIVWCLCTRVHYLLVAVQVPWLKKHIFAMVHKMFHLPLQLPALAGQIWSMFFLRRFLGNTPTTVIDGYRIVLNNTVENQIIKYFKKS